jgi:DnaJ-class molecular chaperone
MMPKPEKQKKLICGVCGGRGWYVWHSNDGKTVENRTCTNCGGTGYVD